MYNPVVTVITPVYNCAEFVNETINSVATQDYKRIRYHIIDDGSTDKPQYIKGDYVLHRHERRLGEQFTVNVGLRLVTKVRSKYFMVVNADDPLLPRAVSNLVAFMEANPDVLCGYPDYNVIGEDGKIRWHVFSKAYDFKWMIQHHTWLPSVGSIFRSEVIKMVGYRDTKFRWLGDADYWLRVGLVGKMMHVPLTLACWRKRDGQASSNRSRLRAKEHIKVMQKFYSTPKLPGSLLRVKAEAICWAYLVAAAVTNNNLEVLQYAAKAVVAYPRLLVDIKLWDLFIKRAYFILRR